MNRMILGTAVLALGMSGLAEASTINATCVANPTVIVGQSGSATENCSFIGLPGGANINSITYNFTFDYTFDAQQNAGATADFSFDGPSTYDFNGTATTGNRPVSSGVTNVLLADFGLFSGGFSIFDSMTGTTGVTTGTFSKSIVLDYTPQQVVPEPITFVLAGFGLTFIGIMRRRNHTMKKK